MTMPRLAIAAVLLLAASGSAAAGPFDALLYGLAEDLGDAVSLGLPGADELATRLVGAVAPVGGAAADATLRTAANVAGASRGYATMLLGLDPDAALLAGSGDGRQGTTVCRGMPVLVEFSDKGTAPTVVLLLGPAPAAPECAPRTAQFGPAELQGDWTHGWIGATPAGEVLRLGPHGDGGAISVHFEQWQGGVVQFRFAGSAADLA